MKHLSRVLCLLLMLALLLPGALAEAVEQTEQTEQIDSGIEKDEVEKVGDIFDMYQVGSMVEANGKLYTISSGPTICEFDGENWRIAVVANSFSDVLRVSDDYSFYSDETSAVLSVDEDGTLLLLYPYSDGVIDLLRVPLDGSDVTRVHSFRLVEDSGDEDGSLYFSLQGAALTSDYAYVTAYGMNPEATYGLNQLFELNLKDGSVRKVTEDYIGIILPLDDTSLIGYYDNRYTGADDPLTALVRINRQTGLTDTLCEMESGSSFSGFTMSGTSVVFNDGSQVLRVAAPYDTVETVGYLPPAYVYTNLPGCVSGNSYYTYNYDTGLTSIDLTAPLPATVLRIDSSISWGDVGELVRQYVKEHPEVGVVYASTTASTAPDYTQHMQSGEALDLYSFYLPGDAFAALRNKGYLAELSGSSDLLAAVSEMFPNLTKQVLVDGHLYALPVEVSTSCWSIDTAVLEDVGLTAEDVPTTYLELLNLIDEWITSYVEDYPEHALMDYPYSLSMQLFGQIMLAQIAECEADGRTLTFTDADFIATLNKLDSMREKLQAYENQWNDDNNSGNIVYSSNTMIVGSYDASSSEGPLLSSYVSSEGPLLSSYVSIGIHYASDRESTAVPLMLSIQPNHDSSVIGNLRVMAVNRSSKNADAAMNLLTYLAVNRSDYQKSLFSPAYTDNIEDPHYEETKASHESFIDELTKAMATADDSEKRDYQEAIQNLTDALTRLSPYQYTTEDILLYDSQMENVRIIESTVFYGDDNEASTLVNRYMDGNITVDQFVRELTRIVQMMIMENS